MKKKVLLLRLDKIGDLICTLPTDQILDPELFEVTWVVQKGLGQIIDLGEKNRNYIELDKSKPQISQELLSVFLIKNSFDYAISFQCPWWVNYALWGAGIKHRIGVLSQWHSFLFLNEGLRQKRSKATRHEFDYNIELVEKMTGPIQNKNLKENIYFKLRKPNTSMVLQKFNLPIQYVVIHPGMMGSALNWPQEKYIQLIHKLIASEKKVVITGTDSDEPYLTQIKSEFYQKNNQVFWLQSQLSLSQLVEVLNYAEFVVAPSTGVLHLAAALDKEVHGIYSEVPVHHPTRWAPRGPHVHVYLPKPGRDMSTVEVNL